MTFQVYIVLFFDSSSSEETFLGSVLITECLVVNFYGHTRFSLKEYIVSSFVIYFEPSDS